jgi:hypothetical protein
LTPFFPRRAAYSNDNQVIKMLFHGTLAFAQNREPFESRAAKERVISIKFSTDELTDDSKAAYDQVCALPVPKLAGFLLAVLKEREFFESNWRSYHVQAKKDLLHTVPDNRINENHAVLLAFHRLLCEKFGISHDLLAYFEEIGSQKIIACEQRTLTPADFFFDKLDELPETIQEPSTTLNVWLPLCRNILLSLREAWSTVFRAARAEQCGLWCLTSSG